MNPTATTPMADFMETGMQEQNKQDGSVSTDNADPQRRALLASLGKAAYIAPATLALLSVEARAASNIP